MQIKYGNSQHEIEAKPITILCHTGHNDAEVVGENVERITPFDTLEFTNSLSEQDWQNLKDEPRFMQLVKLVATDFEPNDIHITKHGNGIKHVVGLVYLSLMARHKGKMVHWQYPETHLHPRWQTGLSDLAIFLTK